MPKIDLHTIPKDQMTPIERAAALKAGKPVDRIPCSPMVAELTSRIIGVSVQEYITNPKAAALAQAKAFEYFGYDSVSVSPDHHGFADAMGAKFTYYDHDRPQIKEYLMSCPEDIAKVHLVNPKQVGRLKICLESVARLQDLVGTKVKVGSGVGGPLTCASFLRRPDQLLKDMIKRPQLVHQLMEINTENIISYMAAAWEHGVGCSVGDSFSSSTVISPKYFRQFVKPYLKRIADWQIANMGSAGNLHICGESKPLWQDMAELGFSSVSLDNCVDLAEAKNQIGHLVALKGNVPPIDVMLLGSVDEVYEGSRACINKAITNPKGFTLSSGCTLPVETPLENVMAMVNSARLWGSPITNRSEPKE